MHMKSTVVVAAALCLAIAPAATAQTPVTKTKSVSATATIQAIDSTTRSITLRDETGVEDTYVAGPEVKRFDELKVGDTVKMTYYESVFLQVRKAGAAADRTTGDKPAADRRGGHQGHGRPARRHGGGAGQDDRHRQGDRSGSAVDHRQRHPTAAPSRARSRTRRTSKASSAGDLIDITYTRALLTSGRTRQVTR